MLSRFKYAHFVTVTPNMLDFDFEPLNINIDDYSNHLTNAGARRAKSHPLHNAEYMIFKEITRSTHNGNILPHLHIIVLSDTVPAFSHALFDFHIIPITPDHINHKKNDRFNPLLQSIKNLFIYSTKSDDTRLHIERALNLSHGKSDIRVSSLFRAKSQKSHTLLPINILMKKIASHTLIARRKALSAHTAYKAAHPNAKHITIHKHALKTKKRIEAIEKEGRELKARLREKLKRAERRRNRRLSRTHSYKMRL